MSLYRYHVYFMSMIQHSWRYHLMADQSADDAGKWKFPVFVFFQDARNVFKRDELGLEIMRIALPAALALAADPIASLIDTAFIGHLGPVEMAAVGVSIAIFNQASKVTIFPLVSITTSFVAEEDTINTEHHHLDLEKASDTTSINAIDDKTRKIKADEEARTCVSKVESKEKRHISSASTALVLGLVLGIIQTIFLVFLAKPLLRLMGVKLGSPMLEPAERYLTIRSLGAPAVLLSLAMQGIFRGFKDTKTPLYAIVIGDLTNIILDPILIFVCRWGVAGAAIAHVLSQYLITLILFTKLATQIVILPPSLKHLQLKKFLKNGSFLLTRVIAVTICVTLAASLAARFGPTPMAAFQISLQVWLTSSLLADGLAVAGQAILACAFAEKEYKKATAAATRVLQMGFVLGIGLAVLVGVGLQFGSGIFSKDKNVIHMIAISMPFVAATQPINSLAFVFDGVNFGASDFAYSAYSMVLVSIVSIGSLFLLSKAKGFIGIWLALTIYMGLRTFAGFWRMGTGTGPWGFLKGTSSS
ncbi:protein DETOXIFICATION 43-like [Salvia splendens]|uniref:protein DETOXIFICATION 43-like n=1 Tax=Salvia splendens TaxID=180675 RepID=UPI001C26AC9E|nr:protein DETOXIFICATION 43-like [Salvia splendens]